MLGAHREDREFDPTQRSYYYVRVLEVPTPSRLAHDKAHFGAEMPELPDDTLRVQ